MAGPSQAWLQAGMDLSGLGIGAPPPAGPMFVPLGGAPAPAPVQAPAGPPPPPPPTTPAPAPAPAPVPAAAQPAPQQAAPAQPQPMPNDVQFVRVGGGSSPAREAPTMGPQQQAHMMASFAPQEQAATNIAERVGQQAITDQLEYQRQAEAAQAREEMAVATKQRRVDELEGLQQDYSDTVQKLGQMHLDSNRWWAQKTTGDKVATGILAFLGGLGALGTGGPNLAWEAIKRDMDADVEAQKFDYQTTMDRAKGAQNAFSMAMERYGSEDAATAAARAAALDFSAAKVGQLAAHWKGVDAQNAADDLLGRIAAEREKTIASGFRYVPATQQASRYAMMVRGQMLPGTVSEDRAQTYTLEHGVKPAEQVDLKMVEGGIKAATEKAAAGGKREEKVEEGAKHIATKLQEAGVPSARAAAEKAKAALTASPGGKGEAAVRFVARNLPIVGGPVAGEAIESAVMPDTSNAREQAMGMFEAQMLKVLMGNVTNGDEARAKKILGSTSDPASRERTVDNWRGVLDDIERNVQAGVSPESQKLYAAQLEAAKPGGRPAAPASASTSWSKK